MAKIDWKLRVLRKKYAEGLDKGLVSALYRAYIHWNRQAYPIIVRTAPRSKTPSTRWPSGFVASHIKLVPKKKPPYSYEEVDVPGKFSTGSRAWRAWIIIKTLHEGWTKLPFKRKPTRKRVLKLPGRPPHPRYVREVVQERQLTFNPWITRVWKLLEPNFPIILKEEIAKTKKVKKKEKLA